MLFIGYRARPESERGPERTNGPITYNLGVGGDFNCYIPY